MKLGSDLNLVDFGCGSGLRLPWFRLKHDEEHEESDGGENNIANQNATNVKRSEITVNKCVLDMHVSCTVQKY